MMRLKGVFWQNEKDIEKNDPVTGQETETVYGSASVYDADRRCAWGVQCCGNRSGDFDCNRQ